MDDDAGPARTPPGMAWPAPHTGLLRLRLRLRPRPRPQRRQRRRVLVALVAVASLALPLAGWARHDRTVAGDTGLAGKLERSADLHAAAGFGWDHAYLFEAYTDAAAIDRALGFTWWRAHLLDEVWLGNDDTALLVFTRGDRVVRYALLSPYQDLLPALEQPGGVTRKQALGAA